jgi:hypothetical protein
MDNKQFDTLARSLVTSGSRRMVLGIPLTGVLSLLGSRQGTAKHKHKHKKHKQTRGTVPPPASSPPSSLPSPPPPPPLPLTCPPACPACQTCDAATGACLPDPAGDGSEGADCAFPNVCCGGTCCDQIRTCASDHTCPTCAAACPSSCTTCVNLADAGAWRCTYGFGPIECERTCTHAADCPGGALDYVCMVSATDRSTGRSLFNISTTDLCPRLPPHTGLCVDLSLYPPCTP